MRRLVVDVLKPHQPEITEFAEAVADTDGVEGANATLIETDREVQNIKITMEGVTSTKTRCPKQSRDSVVRYTRSTKLSVANVPSNVETRHRIPEKMDLRELLRDDDVRSISRRYFISNGFDGTLTSIGIVVGSYLSGISDGVTVFTIGIGAAVGLGTSAVWSVWEIERAEKRAELLRIESAMLEKLEDTELQKRRAGARKINSVASGAGPLVCIVLPLLPDIRTEPGGRRNTDGARGVGRRADKHIPAQLTPLVLYGASPQALHTEPRRSVVVFVAYRPPTRIACV
jgi:hypothetical protein